MKVAIASDHAGYDLKEIIKKHLTSKNIEYIDFGCNNSNSMDYPDVIHPLSQAVSENKFEFGIIICGSGNGVSMTANKYPKIRAALCWMDEIAALARQHNNANIISIPARFVTSEQSIKMVDTFLITPFEGGRHALRVNKIAI